MLGTIECILKTTILKAVINCQSLGQDYQSYFQTGKAQKQMYLNPENFNFKALPPHYTKSEDQFQKFSNLSFFSLLYFHDCIRYCQRGRCNYGIHGSILYQMYMTSFKFIYI